MLKRSNLRNPFWLLCFLVFSVFWSGDTCAQGSAASWIWYPGDFEIWLSNEVQIKRTKRDVVLPPWWRVYSHNSSVSFGKHVNLKQEEEIQVVVEGKFNITIDGKYLQGDLSRIIIPEGKHTINFQVFNSATPPSIFISGKTIVSDTTWYSNTVRGAYPENANNLGNVKADTWTYLNKGDMPPSKFKLPTEEKSPVKIETNPGSMLIDFGDETFGFLRFKALKGSGKIDVYYGESIEEALSMDSCETLDHFTIANLTPSDFIAPQSRAFRYVNIKCDADIEFDSIDMLYEYLPLSYRGTFNSSDAELNTIWKTSANTLQLNTREFFLDGIKRDRWIWSGDANQSYLMNYYLFFDNSIVKRTIWAVRGGEPVEAHINTILDYSFYWFISIYDYYLYTGDLAFIKKLYPRMISLMEFCLDRRNNNGMVEGLPGDWLFLDWAPISKEGELSAIQILFCRSLESMALCASLLNDTKRSTRYASLSKELKAKVLNTFWDDGQAVLLHNRKNNQLEKDITRYPNMFAVMFGYLDSTKTGKVKSNVLLNDNVLRITTPYMRFYELEALCAVGEQKYVMKEMKDYWGGMLNAGATTFWELYDQNEKGTEQYAMYGRPFGKSLCHAWGASPIYLLGKYYLGVKPIKPGYEEYVIEPNLGGLEWMEGKVPTPRGDVSIKVMKNKITVTGSDGIGVLRFKSQKKPTANSGSIRKTGDTSYELRMEPGKEYRVAYVALLAN